MDYVTFRLGMSIFKQLPKTIDRDLDQASRAILYFEEVSSSFPQSPLAKEALAKANEAKKMLAEKEYYIADYYFIRGKWQSALGRYEDLLGQHANLGFDQRALYGASISALRLRELDKANRYLKDLGTKFPNSTEYAKAKKEFED
jgi:outer membrane protein assembly factor BamD